MNDDVYVDAADNEPQTDDIEQLQEKLSDANEQLDKARFENLLAVELGRAGVIDLEAAIKLAGPGDNPTDVTSELKSERPYLFANPRSASPPSLGPRARRRENVKAQLTAAADTAKNTGSRKDLYEYLKLRRSFKN